MAEPLKNSFGPDVVEGIGDDISAVYPAFETARYLQLALDGFDELELTPRARQIAAALADTLPANREEALDILLASLGPRLPTSTESSSSDGAPSEPSGAMDGFRYLPHGYFVAEHGLEHFSLAMRFQEELTMRFTAEFSIRAFFEHHESETLAQAQRWAVHENEHVRRLASEGSRTRLPWASRLPRFIEDPTEVFGILELLRNDPSEYVRRSVANNLNDIAKDHPDQVIAVAKRWWDEAEREGTASTSHPMIRHGLRTLIKKGDLAALSIMGFGPESPAVVTSVTVDPPQVAIGSSVRVHLELTNPSDEPAGALADIVVHFVKSNGSTSAKVFKGKELTIAPGETTIVKKTISVAQQTTRTHYPGTHAVEIQLNGVRSDGAEFDLTAN